MSRTFVLLVCLVGCDLTQEGAPPPPNDLYFPTVLELGRDEETGEPDYLYVVNSNFDRRYNAGNLLAIDLDDLDRVLAETARSDEDCDQARGDCVIDPADVVADEVVIGSLGRGAALSRDGQHLYVAAAVDPGLMTIDLLKEDGLKFDCGQGSGRRCSGDLLAGGNPSANPDGVRVPDDPVGVMAGLLSDLSTEGTASDYIMVAYRFGEVALFVRGNERVPVLADVLDRRPRDLTGLGYEPATRTVLVTSVAPDGSGAKSLQRLSVLVDEDSPANSALLVFPPLALEGVATSRNSWALDVVPRADDEQGRRQSTAFIVSQRPNALLRVNLNENAGSTASVDRITPVGTGASRLALGTLGEAGSQDALDLAVVSCFSERRIFVIDRTSGRALSIVSGFSGSFELVVDEVRQLVYVADFRSSVVRVVSLKGLADGAEARIIASIGTPKLVEELQ